FSEIGLTGLMRPYSRSCTGPIRPISPIGAICAIIAPTGQIIYFRQSTKRRRQRVNNRAIDAGVMLVRFLLYGFLGWSVEIFWSAVEDVWPRRKWDWRLRGQSNLWSFPIYGLAVFLFEPLHDAVRQLPWVARGMIYVAAIWIVEYAAGWTL